jgi:hypothetical protein
MLFKPPPDIDLWSCIIRNEVLYFSGRSTDVESIGSYRSWDKNWDKLDRFDNDNLYEV